MRAVIQRVNSASVEIENKIKGEINMGVLILLGIEETDSNEDIEWLSGKISRLRIFDDKNGVLNKSVCDVDGGLLVISQFTLHASTKKGNRPSYIKAARLETAIPLYEKFLQQLNNDTSKEIKSGEFGAYMKVSLVNDGPVTIVIDTKKRE